MLHFIVFCYACELLSLRLAEKTDHKTLGTTALTSCIRDLRFNVINLKEKLELIRNLQCLKTHSQRNATRKQHTGIEPANSCFTHWS